MKVAAHGQTDSGLKRSRNDDFYLIDEDLGLFVVCDGVGGHAAGSVASRLCAEAIQNFVRSRRDVLAAYQKQPRPDSRSVLIDLLRKAVEWGNTQVFEHAEKEPAQKGMSTTVDALLLLADYAVLAHVGDSRTYLVRGGQTHLLTEDHKVAAEMVRQGLWTEEQARKSSYHHVLSRAIGMQSLVQVDVLQVELTAGDRFLLCSDGLADYLDGRVDLQGHFAGGKAPKDIVRELVEFAKSRGGHDNITALAVAVEGAAPRQSAGPAHRNEAALDALRKAEILGKVPLFRYLSYAELMKVLAIVRLQSHPAGTALLEEGSPSGEMFILVDGSVEIFKAGQSIAKRGKGEFFGEMGLLDHAPRSASVRTAEPSVSMALDRKELLLLLRQESQIAVKFLWALNQEISQRLRITSEDLAMARAELKMRQAKAQDLPFPLPR
jgi:serine/threonine protein phosphatase PrpC/CRP-like cAMP-binding protein